MSLDVLSKCKLNISYFAHRVITLLLLMTLVWHNDIWVIQIKELGAFLKRVIRCQNPRITHVLQEKPCQQGSQHKCIYVRACIECSYVWGYMSIGVRRTQKALQHELQLCEYSTLQYMGLTGGAWCKGCGNDSNVSCWERQQINIYRKHSAKVVS